MAEPLPETPAVPPPEVARRGALCVYAIGGDLRYLAHHDELRMLTRALVRAEWPLSWTQGFNPRPRLSIVLPRSVGTAADGQVARVELVADAAPGDLFARLAGQLPAGCTLERVVVPAPRAKPRPVVAVYEVEVEPRDWAGLPERGAALLARAEVVVPRRLGPGRPVRAVDLRPGIESVDWTDGVLRMRLRAGVQPAARPSEIITELGLDRGSYVHRLRRVAVQWDTELWGPGSALATSERIELGEEEHYSQEVGT